MLAGILHQAGYFMGEKLYPPLPSNPKGFFEWKEINQINEKILSNYGKSFASTIIKRLFKKNLVKDPGRNQRWLLSLSANVDVQGSDSSTAERIKKVIQREPFCYKDPRFSYTLPVWKRFLKPDTAFICVFREPNVTVESILKECKSRDYLADLWIKRKSAYKVWTNIYSHILSNNGDALDNFFFIHCRQIYGETAITALSGFLNIDLKKDFVDKNLNRTTSQHPMPKKVKVIYRRLCELANYNPDG